MEDRLALTEGWRKTDLTWRPSMQRMLASARLYGVDLTDGEKKTLGISPKQLAFRQKDSVPTQAQNAGVRAGDIILGIEDRTLELDADGFLRYVRGNFLVGDQVTVHLLRDGKRMNLSMTFLR